MTRSRGGEGGRCCDQVPGGREGGVVTMSRGGGGVVTMSLVHSSLPPPVQ